MSDTVATGRGTAMSDQKTHPRFLRFYRDGVGG
jgi:hypothetical protein